MALNSRFTKYDLDLCQEILLDDAIKITDILDKNNIPYILNCGTLLGAVRHKGFIPWDDDFDIALFEQDYDKALEVLKNNLPKYLLLQNESTEKKYFHGWSMIRDTRTKGLSLNNEADNIYAENGLSIDLFLMKKLERNKVKESQLNEALKYYKKRLSLSVPSSYNYVEKIALTENELKRIRNQLRNPIFDDYVYTISHHAMNFSSNVIFPLKKYEFCKHFFYGPNDYNTYLKYEFPTYMDIPPKDKQKTHFDCVTFGGIPNSKFTVKKYGNSDCKVSIEDIVQYYKDVKDILPKNDLTNDQIDRWFEKIKKLGAIFVLTDNKNRIFGLCFGYANNTDSHTAFCSTLVVSVSLQNKGFGKQLLFAFENYAILNGMKFILLSVADSNIKAQSIYKKYGYIYFGKNTQKQGRSFFRKQLIN